MSKLIINDQLVIEGKASVERAMVDGSLQIAGLLSAEDYIEEIHEIESMRFKLEGVDVAQESFGTEENTIVYTFTAKKMTVFVREGEKDDEQN